jgi:histidine triad (HIT) family protein
MCVFCKIINGEIPAFKVYETEDLVAFLDISQATKGHTLIVPKKHYENLLALDEEMLMKISVAQKEVANILSKKLGTNAFNFVNNCGSVAGQSVMHVHFHVIPRYENDDFKMHIVEHEPNFEELAKLHKQITE